MFERIKNHPPKVEKEFTKDEIKLLLQNNLGRVGGEAKPLGYLPKRTITDICKVDIDDLKDELIARELTVLELSDKEANVNSGALFAYDYDALSRALHSGKQVLERNGWPTEPEAFVRQLKIVAVDPELRTLIKGIYGNPDSKV